MADIYSENRVREIAREEITDSPIIITLLSGVDELKTDLRRMGVVVENIDSKLDVVLEVLSDTARNANRVFGHEERISKLESHQKLISKTLRLHSRQLKTT